MDYTYGVFDKGFDIALVFDHGDYRYYAGRPEQGPTYDCGGEPAEPEEIEILSGMVELDFCEGSFKRLFDAYINATDTVFDTLCEANEEALTEGLLEFAGERDVY